MREILFRGKRIDNGEWVEGSLIMWPDGATDICYSENDSFVEMMKTIIDPASVGQFTGLTDKNGKKIFKGDIGRYKQTDGATQNGKPITCIGKVIYNAKTASFAVESKDEAGRKYFDYFPIKDFEVIGNIHDNPELIGGGESG